MNKKIIKRLLIFMLGFLFAFISIRPTRVNASELTQIISEAYSHLGAPYVYGGNGPSNFDCSGFTSYVYNKAVGINIGRTTYDQIDAGREVSQNDLQPGDLIFPHTGHVELYIGDGYVIHAPKTGDVVKVAPLGNIYMARRIIADSKIEQIIFDYKYYADTYQDLKNAFGYDKEALYRHYVTNGIKEGRSPSVIFNPKYYLENNQDLKNAFGDNYEDAYNHFVSCGYKEDRPSSDICNIGVYKNRHNELSGKDNLEIYELYLENPENTAIYKVRFFGYNKEQIGNTQYIVNGEKAIAPLNMDNIQGYEFKKWDKQFEHITQNTDIYAVYEKIEVKENTEAATDTVPSTTDTVSSTTGTVPSTTNTVPLTTNNTSSSDKSEEIDNNTNQILEDNKENDKIDVKSENETTQNSDVSDNISNKTSDKFNFCLIIMGTLFSSFALFISKRRI